MSSSHEIYGSPFYFSGIRNIYGFGRPMAAPAKFSCGVVECADGNVILFQNHREGQDPHLHETVHVGQRHAFAVCNGDDCSICALRATAWACPRPTMGAALLGGLRPRNDRFFRTPPGAARHPPRKRGGQGSGNPSPTKHPIHRRRRYLNYSLFIKIGLPPPLINEGGEGGLGGV